MLGVKKDILKKNIKDLSLDLNIIEILNQHEIYVVDELWCLNRKNLKDYGLRDADINHIIIKLQLLGLDLNKRINK